MPQVCTQYGPHVLGHFFLTCSLPGFTGRLIVRRLCNHPERSSFTFAIGVRSKAKGEALKRSLGIDDDVPLVEGRGG